MFAIPSRNQLSLFILCFLTGHISTSNHFPHAETDNKSTQNLNLFKIPPSVFNQYHHRHQVHIQKRFADDGYSIVPREYYKKTDYYLMLAHIFKEVKFANKQCDVTFQNCLLDMNNKRNVKGHDFLSETCFPLQKSRYCLEESNYVKSECLYKTVHYSAQKYFTRLSTNLESCIRRYPTQVSSNRLGGNQSSRSSFRQISVVQLVLGLIIVPSITHLF